MMVLVFSTSAAATGSVEMNPLSKGVSVEVADADTGKILAIFEFRGVDAKNGNYIIRVDSNNSEFTLSIPLGEGKSFNISPNNKILIMNQGVLYYGFDGIGGIYIKEFYYKR
jgi:hypothetical protein